jgi:hypothetical protein
MKHYRSSIPSSAQEQMLRTRPRGQEGHRAEYFLNGEVVGMRQFDASDQLQFERPLRNGVTHGTVYSIDQGVVTFCGALPKRTGPWSRKTMVNRRRTHRLLNNEARHRP